MILRQAARENMVSVTTRNRILMFSFGRGIMCWPSGAIVIAIADGQSSGTFVTMTLPTGIGGANGRFVDCVTLRFCRTISGIVATPLSVQL